MIASLDIAALKDRFYLEQCPFWFMYELNAKRTQISRFRDDYPDADPEDKLDYAWMQLEELFSAIPYGRAEVTLKKTESSARDKSPVYKVEWGVMPNGGRRGAAVGQVAASGAGNWEMMRYFMEQNNRMLQMNHEVQLKLQQSEFEKHMLQQALESDSAPSMQEELLKEGIGALKMWIAKPSAPPARPVHLGTMGQREEPVESSAAGNPEQPADDKPRPMDFNQALGYVQHITDLFPEYDRIDVLKAFYALAKSNHAIIKAQLDQYIQSNG